MSTSNPPAPAAQPKAKAESASDKRRRLRDEYVTAVAELCTDKGIRADLRSGLGRPLEQCGRMHRWLAWRVPQDSFGERAPYAVASLIADRPRSVREAQTARADAQAADATGSAVDPAAVGPMPWTRRPNLGTSLALAVLAGMKEGTAESHLRLLTRQSFASVHPRLPSLLQYVQDKDAAGQGAVDWAVLLDDLARWDLRRDEIATRWLQSFYRTLHTPRQPAADPTGEHSPNFPETRESEAL